MKLSGYVDVAQMRSAYKILDGRSQERRLLAVIGVAGWEDIKEAGVQCCVGYCRFESS
jgi:hypothetical protein